MRAREYLGAFVGVSASMRVLLKYGSAFSFKFLEYLVCVCVCLRVSVRDYICVCLRVFVLHQLKVSVFVCVSV
jgi:hypothetical protein